MADPIAKFLECHERIRRFTDGIARLADLPDLGHPLAPATAEACARYFRDGLPLHGEDEDESLAPRLRQHPVAPEVLAALDRMSAEHVEMHRILPTLLELLERVAQKDPPTPAELRVPVEALNRILLAHIEMEEKVIFPACGVLTRKERQAIVDEIGARRR